MQPTHFMNEDGGDCPVRHGFQRRDEQNQRFMLVILPNAVTTMPMRQLAMTTRLKSEFVLLGQSPPIRRVHRIRERRQAGIRQRLR